MREKLSSLFLRGWTWTRRQDIVVLLCLFTLVVCAWGFIELADEVREGSTGKIDAAILEALRNPENPSMPLGPLYVREAFRDLTALGSLVVLSLASGAVAGFFLISRRYAGLVLLILALGGGNLLSKLLKNYFERPRPEYVTTSHYVDTYSFPSGHALSAAVVYLTLGALVSRVVATRWQKIYVLAIAALLAFLVGFSRVYLGVHHPSDVLGGWSVGLLWAIICWFAARSLQRRGRIEPPGSAPRKKF